MCCTTPFFLSIFCLCFPMRVHVTTVTLWKSIQHPFIPAPLAFIPAGTALLVTVTTTENGPAPLTLSVSLTRRAWTGCELIILLPQPPESCNYRCVLLCLLYWPSLIFPPHSPACIPTSLSCRSYVIPSPLLVC